jgi:hypothetical protein
MYDTVRKALETVFLARVAALKDGQGFAAAQAAADKALAEANALAARAKAAAEQLAQARAGTPQEGTHA